KDYFELTLKQTILMFCSARHLPCWTAPFLLSLYPDMGQSRLFYCRFQDAARRKMWTHVKRQKSEKEISYCVVN
ncbi:MAG: hypothetical protein ACTSWE_01490, partial [Promethearchaeota archaeon]